MERFLIKANDALAAAVKAKAAEDLQEPDQWIMGVLAAHASGKCGGTAPLAAPAAAVAHETEPARGRGRPAGGNLEASKTRDAIMTGDRDAVKAALIECGFFPGPDGVETVEGDPKNPAKNMELTKYKAKELYHEIMITKNDPAQLSYVQITRTYNTPVDGENSDSMSIRTTTRQELWAMVKSEGKK